MTSAIFAVASAIFYLGAAGAPSEAPAAPSPVAPSAPATPSAPAVPAPDPAQGAAEAAAALRATQDLEAKLIQLSAELTALENQRASWADLRGRLDELSRRYDQLAPPAEPGAQALERRSGAVRMGVVSGGDGILFRSPDGSFALRPSLYLQARYEGALVERAPGASVAPDRSGFLLRHAELMLEGHVFSSRFEYRLQVDFAEPLLLKDVFAQARILPSLAIRVGQFKIPFGFQRYLRSTYYDFTDLSAPMAAFSLERDVGTMLVGRPLGGRLQYQLAVTNGSGQGRPNDNRDLAYALRMVAAPLGPLPDSEGDLVGQRRPLFSVGAAATYNLIVTDIVARTGNPDANVDVDGDGRVDNVGVWQGGLELRAHWRGAALQAEYFQRREHPGASAADRSTHGEYAQASYFIIPHLLQVAARLEGTDLPLYGVPLALRQAAGTHIDAQTGAINAYLRGHDLKVQLDYSHLRTAGIEMAAVGPYTQDSHRVRAQVQLMF
jgi:hypothetical protein